MGNAVWGGVWLGDLLRDAGVDMQSPQPVNTALERFEQLPQRPAGAWWGQLEIMKLQTYWAEKCRVMMDLLLNDPEAVEHVGNYGHLVWFPSELAWLGLRLDWLAPLATAREDEESRGR